MRDASLVYVCLFDYLLMAVWFYIVPGINHAGFSLNFVYFYCFFLTYWIIETVSILEYQRTLIYGFLLLFNLWTNINLMYYYLSEYQK